MSFLTTIISSVLGGFLDRFIEPAKEMFGQYINKQITEAQLREKLGELVLTTFRDIEVAYQDTLAKTYASFMQAMVKSRLMQQVWATVVLSQLFVLLWHQMAIPFITFVTGLRYPSSGTTVEWAYLLIGALLGSAGLLFRSGPGSGLTTFDALNRSKK